MRYQRTRVFAAMAAVCVFAGCAFVQEAGKTIWGSSVRQLEKHRVDAIGRTYHKGYWECLQAVLTVIGESRPLEFSAADLNASVLRNSLKGEQKADSIILEKLNMKADQVDDASPIALAEALNQVLKMRDFAVRIGAAYKITLLPDIQELLGRARSLHNDLNGQETSKLNEALLKAIYPQAIQKSGISQKYLIFQKDEIKGYIILMGVPGYVDTTEVGIFFVEISDNEVRIELSSLSTNAKRAVAKTLFKGLDKILGTP